ncbi:molybdopterin-dependent oxidoreductase [Klebsiella pneumoniae subsp. pneumoniae]|nr:molybdopterin-dependent oxidoreductase [Klebsiella pneumoniae subsp. pneumoniae]
MHVVSGHWLQAGLWRRRGALQQHDDVENSDLVVLVGSNAAWAHPVLFQRLAQAKRDNPRLRIVAIDPSTHRYLRDRRPPSGAGPGSDGGLFVGLLNALAGGRSLASMAFATARAGAGRRPRLGRGEGGGLSRSSCR